MSALDKGALRGSWREQVPLARYTSWRVGGPARRLYRPADREDLLQCLRSLDPAEPLLWLGLGSNLLVRDGGFPGTVILTRCGLNVLRQCDARRVYAEAGVSSAKLSRFIAQHGGGGLEFLAGIPGTVGGALALNAGAFGSSIWAWVRWVETVDRYGVVRRRDPTDYQIEYRQVHGPPDEWFIAAELAPAGGEPETVRARMRALLEQRAMRQPLGLASAGSTFRNPPGDYAARLIEAAGLKGCRVGGAEVSLKHANFIINIGNARAAEIEALIAQIQTEVKRQFGVWLDPEIHRVGITA